MVNKDMRNMFSTIIMTLVLLVTIFGNTTARTTIPDSNSFPFDDLSKEKIVKINVTLLQFKFGFIIVDAIIKNAYFVRHWYAYLSNLLRM